MTMKTTGLLLILFALLFLFTMDFTLILRYKHLMKVDAISSNSQTSSSCRRSNKTGLGYLKITWYNPPLFLNARPDAKYSGFHGCIYINCIMTFNSSDARDSDAIIFTSRYFPPKLRFTRPNGQIWIFYEHEPPYRYRHERYRWLPKNSFNWTMTYDHSIADIYLPYGEIRQKSSKTNFTDDAIMQRTKRTALMVVSHCKTPANRLRYVDQLKQYIEVDILGKCGTKWTCGLSFEHGDCFEVLNNYKFYLAFENSFCNNYFTEKVFERFDYDTVLVTRGGRNGEIKQLLPEGTYISTDDFENAKELGLYLRSMPDITYLKILQRKQQFTASYSYKAVFHRAMCETCMRINNAHLYTNTITDIENLVLSANFCVNRNDF